MRTLIQLSRRRPAPARFGWIALMLAGLTAALLSGCVRTSGPRGVTPVPALRFGTRPSGAIGVQAGTAPSFSRQSAAAPGSLPSLDEELWVIARAESPAAKPADDMPGSGSMVGKSAVEEMLTPLPLQHTEVTAAISGYIATVTVTQQFRNPYDGKIEAVYVFPLPHNAAVNEFLMVIGERRIRGIIRERREAERIYTDAKRQGYVASLLTQERPNVFTQSVANIEPGKRIDVQITYFHTLAYDDGWYEFVFPMVVGPRFNPPGSTNGIGAVARGARGISDQPTEMQYLRPGVRSGHDIALKADIAAGVAIEEIVCRSHVVAKQIAANDRVTVSLSPNDRIPNKDFVLRYRVAGDRVKSSLITHRGEHGGFFTLMLYPPMDLASLTRQPVEMVFVLDCSGSMSGRPLEQAKQAVERTLRQLGPDDTFQIIRFSDNASRLGRDPIHGTPDNIRKGLDYLGALNSRGGTMMIKGIRAALSFAHDPERLRFVCFLTDGYIGNEVEILGEIQKQLGASRVFSFGVGSSVNRYLLESMAKLGRGAVAYLGPNDSAARVMDAFASRIRHPALTDLQIDWGGATVKDVFPKRAPDLFVGRPVILTGRFEGAAPDAVRVTGQANRDRRAIVVETSSNRTGEKQSGLASVWARMKIAGLADQAALEPNDELEEAIRQVALDFGLLSSFTAFVAVDSSRRAEGREGTTIPVAVPAPDGVRYETTVDER